jgi:hypothetical protein
MSTEIHYDAAAIHYVGSLSIQRRHIACARRHRHCTLRTDGLQRTEYFKQSVSQRLREGGTGESPCSRNRVQRGGLILPQANALAATRSTRSKLRLIGDLCPTGAQY